MSWILLFLLMALFVGSMPRWPYNKNWSNTPSIAIGIVMLIAMMFMFTN